MSFPSRTVTSPAWMLALLRGSEVCISPVPALDGSALHFSSSSTSFPSTSSDSGFLSFNHITISAVTTSSIYIISYHSFSHPSSNDQDSYLQFCVLRKTLGPTEKSCFSEQVSFGCKARSLRSDDKCLCMHELEQYQLVIIHSPATCT